MSDKSLFYKGFDENTEIDDFFEKLQAYAEQNETGNSVYILKKTLDMMWMMWPRSRRNRKRYPKNWKRKHELPGSLPRRSTKIRRSRDYRGEIGCKTFAGICMRY